MGTSRHYVGGTLTDTDFELEFVSNFAKKRHAVWFDLVDPTPADIEKLAEELDLHELAVEDSIKGRQRPKLDYYESHLYITLYQAKFDRDAGEVGLAEISIFVTKYAVVTVRRGSGFDMAAVEKRWDDSSELAVYGTAFLLWGILDVVIDGYFDIVQPLDEELEALEDIMFAPARTDTLIQRRSYQLRKALVQLRRVAVPIREVINPLLKHNGDILHNDMMPYYQDLYDHTMRVADWSESLRDLVTTLLETHLTIQGNRLNQIMKQVTSWAAIIAV
ncbi:MAG: magnesium transporter CorA family protein, partial [Micrococcales bacterium]